MDETTYTDDGVPLFGAGADVEATVDFAVEALNAETGQREQHRFSAWRDPGPEFVMGFLRAGGSEAAELHASAVLIRDALIDHDGISASATAESLGDEWSDDLADWSSRRRFLFLVEDPGYRLPAMMPVDLAKFLAKEALQRRGPVQGEPVPTAAPSPSRRGRTTKRPGSTAKRPPKG